MKKTVLFAAALFAVTAASAQTGEITSNRGENWLSQDGDWGLTFDAQPLLNYAGNLFNGHTNNGGVALNNLWSSNNGSQVIIGGKKLIDANTAYRGKLRIGFGSNKNTVLVNDVTSTSTPQAQVDDVEKLSYMAINLGFGLEKRVGSTRVVGIYGAELNVGFGNSKTTYEYGNALTSTNQNPTNTFGQNSSALNEAVTEVKNGSTFGVAVNAFAGVEWFCAPKISLSGEYTWGIAMSSTGHGSVSEEHWNTASNSVQSTSADNGTKNSNFSIDTGVSGARIGVNFYFQ